MNSNKYVLKNSKGNEYFAVLDRIENGIAFFVNPKGNQVTRPEGGEYRLADAVPAVPVAEVVETLPAPPAKIALPPVAEKQIEVVEVAPTIPRSPRLVAPFAPEFEPVSLMGQESASMVINAQLESFATNGKFAASLLISGPAGVGKTFVSKAFVGNAIKLGVDASSVVVTGSIEALALTTGDKTKAFINALRNSAYRIPSIVILDECHKMKDLGAAMTRIFQTLIFGSGEGWKGEDTIEFLGETIPFNRSFLCLIMATNFPKAIQSKNSSALERRFAHIELVRYDSETMRKLVSSYFKNKGITFDASVKKPLEKLNRGTFEALDEILRKLALTEGSHLSQDKLEPALPYLKFTLRGFTTEEIKAMRWIESGGEPPTFGNFKRNFPKVDAEEMLRHAKTQQTLLKEQGLTATPFIMLGSNRYMLTQTAKDFIKKNKAVFDLIK